MGDHAMQFRRLGRTGMKISVFSFGPGVMAESADELDLVMECMQTAWDAGCNFFDNGETYVGGLTETLMGQALQQLGWPRWSYVLTTKFYWGIHTEGVGNPINMRNTLNRKYLMQGIDASLERLAQPFVDVVYCHRPDPETPIEETVWAMSDIVAAGKALYWGTSEWSADEIRTAIDIADRHHLHKPVTEQPGYNLLDRFKMERDYVRLFEDTGYGATTYAPLASGLLSGKYRDGIPDGSRGSLASFHFVRGQLSDASRRAAVERLRPIAAELECTLAQLALAWCASNPNVSSVITGASRASQVADNFAALGVLERLTPEVLSRIDEAVAKPG